MSIIDRYIAREILVSWLTVLLVLLIIVLSTEVVHLLRWISEGIIPVGAFLSYLVNSMFEFIIVLIPLSLLMGILMGFGRLYRDSEMAAIMAAGIGPLQWYRPLFLVVGPAILLLLMLTLFARPAIVHQRAVLTAEIKSQAEVDTLLVGQFNRASKGGAVLFLESKSEVENQVDNAFFQQTRGDKSHVDIAASTRSLTNEQGHRYMVMEQGIHYEGKPGDRRMKIIEYDEYGIHLDKKQAYVHLSSNSRTVKELWQSDKLEDKAELQWRLAIPIATLIVAFIALPLSKTNPRSGRYSRLALALVLYLLYSNLLGVANTWIIQGKIPVWIGTWWVHIIAMVLLYLLLKRSGYLTPDHKEALHGS